MKRILKSSYFLNTIKITFFLGLFYFLAQKGFLSITATKNALAQLDRMAIALVLSLTCTLLAVVRWHFLLKAQGIFLPWFRTMQLTLVGNFFNVALPGVVSGDVVKAIYVAREVPGKRAHAFSSILFDRVAGVSALILVSMAALVMSFIFNVGHNLIDAIEVVVLLSGASVIAFFLYLFLVHENHDPVLWTFRRLESKLSFFGSFTRIYEGIRNYQEERKTVTAILLLSVFIHFLNIYNCINLTQALGENDVSFLGLFIVIPLGLLLTAIPVMPAGVGTGHAAFLALYSLLGSSRGADVFNLYVLFSLIFQGLIGGLFYLRFKSNEPISETERADWATGVGT